MATRELVAFGSPITHTRVRPNISGLGVVSMAGLLVIVKTWFVMAGGAGLMATGGVMTKLGGNSGGITESSRPLRSQIVRFTMR